MKKRILIFAALTLVIAVAAAAGIHAVRSRIETVEAEVVVNGRETGIRVQICSNYDMEYSILPLTAVLRELGGVVDWVASDEAAVTCNGAVYTLNLTDCTFCEEGTTNNLLIPAPGSRTFSCTALDDEIMLDNNTLHSVLFLMDIPVYIHNWADRQQVHIGIKE